MNLTDHDLNRMIKIEKIWISTKELIHALDTHNVLNGLENRLISETNGHLITLRAILRHSLSTNIQENFIFSSGYISIKAFNLMKHKLARRGLPSRLPFPQGHILYYTVNLLAPDYAHASENCFTHGGVGLH